MPSGMAFCSIFSVIVFTGGFAFGALGLFTISIHRTRRASLFEVNGRQRGAIARSVLLTTCIDRKEGGK
jgi:hypothetical protein